jgi:hypothetical protein
MISAAMAQDAAPASAQAAELYQTLLSSVGALVPASDDTSVVAHWPHVGSSYDGLAIVGQALRGWPDEFDPAGFRSAASRTDAMAVIHRRTAGRTEPMDWLATSRVRNSPFWTVARLATEGLTSGGGPWFSRFAWLNLYPLAPELGNPGGWLREAQDPHVGSLLRALINMIRARTVIALVGPFWWPTGSSPYFADLEHRPRPLIRRGAIDGRTWVVGWHPGGASRHTCVPRC